MPDKSYHLMLAESATAFANSKLSLRDAAKEMVSATGCHYNTAKRLIRRERSGETPMFGWGGPRPNSGRPVSRPEPV